METHERIALDRDQRVALLLHVNQRLYQKGEISKAVYEAAKEKILSIKCGKIGNLDGISVKTAYSNVQSDE